MQSHEHSVALNPLKHCTQLQSATGCHKHELACVRRLRLLHKAFVLESELRVMSLLAGFMVRGLEGLKIP